MLYRTRCTSISELNSYCNMRCVSQGNWCMHTACNFPWGACPQTSLGRHISHKITWRNLREICETVTYVYRLSSPLICGTTCFQQCLCLMCCHKIPEACLIGLQCSCCFAIVCIFLACLSGTVSSLICLVYHKAIGVCTLHAMFPGGHTPGSVALPCLSIWIRLSHPGISSSAGGSPACVVCYGFKSHNRQLSVFFYWQTLTALT